jgi:hypothetical protein
MQIHPIRPIIRLEGRSDMRHPRHGGGAAFYIDIPHYLIDEDLDGFADDLAEGRPANLTMADVTGQVIWGSGAVSEVTWVEFKTVADQTNLSMEIETCDPWPPLGTKAEEHDLGEIDRQVPRHIVDVLWCWRGAGMGPLHQVAARAMAGLTSEDPQATRAEMAVMAALRHGWRDQPIANQFTLIG